MEKTKAFDDAYNCELFFTPPIWSGLFVTSILAFIMMWGLVMIMDIRTMDQFDDPKGKTITISVSE
jgi:V-type H+-transporting ATPase S1 subunit